MNAVLSTHSSFDNVSISFQSAALNNWACLTIGLLNKSIKKEEWERKVNQLVYLREREKFLDNQLDGFVQDPDFRSTEDAAKRLTGEMLKILKVSSC